MCQLPTQVWHRFGADCHGSLVISADEEQIAFGIDLDGKILFEAEINLYAYDGVDKAWIDMGSTSAAKENDCSIQLAITCSRAFTTEPAEPDVYDVEVTRRRLRPDFGDIDPGWGYEE